MMFTTGKYVLNSRKEPVVCDDLDLWAATFKDNQIVKQETVTELGGLWSPFTHPWVSTVFLGLDHNFSDKGPPIVFETMIFGGVYNQKSQWRYATWEEAMKGHDRTVKMVKDPLCMIKQINYNFWYWIEYDGSFMLDRWTENLGKVFERMEVTRKRLTRRFLALKKIFTTLRRRK